MSKPKLDETRMQSELSQSAFFKRSAPAPKASVPSPAKEAAQLPQRSIPTNQERKEPTKQPTLEPRNQGFASPLFEFDLGKTAYRNNTYAFTDDELEAVEDIKTELRRKLDVRTTKNEIIRCGVHVLVEDFRKHGEQSLLVQRLRKKQAR